MDNLVTADLMLSYNQRRKQNLLAKMSQTKKCETCGIIFNRPGYTSEKKWGERRFCNKFCRAKKISHWVKGVKPWNFGTVGVCTPWNKGKKMSLEYRQKLSKAHITTGSTKRDKAIRNSVDFAEWRKKVFARDNYTCKCCLKSKCVLHPHHIYSFSKYPSIRFDVDNGITMCAECHREFHRINGYKNFRGDQYLLMLDSFKTLWKK